MSPRRSTIHSLRSATILEYVILAVGIGITAVCALLAFGEVAQSKMDDATQVLAGRRASDEMDSGDERTPDPRGARGDGRRLGGGSSSDERGESPASRSGRGVSSGGGGLRDATSETISRGFRGGGGGGVSGSDDRQGFRGSGGRSVGGGNALSEPSDHEASDPVGTRRQRWLFWLICAFLFFPLALLTIRLRMN